MFCPLEIGLEAIRRKNRKKTAFIAIMEGNSRGCMSYCDLKLDIMPFQIEYTKDAEKTKHDYNLPHDAPQFVKAKEVAENISDVRNG